MAHPTNAYAIQKPPNQKNTKIGSKCSSKATYCIKYSSYDKFSPSSFRKVQVSFRKRNFSVMILNATIEHRYNNIKHKRYTKEISYRKDKDRTKKSSIKRATDLHYITAKLYSLKMHSFQPYVKQRHDHQSIHKLTTKPC